MADLDKVLKGLEKCLNPNLNCYQYNIDCPYESDCWLSDSLPTRTLKEDALELLKFQQAEIAELKEREKKHEHRLTVAELHEKYNSI